MATPITVTASRPAAVSNLLLFVLLLTTPFLCRDS
jgi:hypothetical protein